MQLLFEVNWIKNLFLAEVSGRWGAFVFFGGLMVLSAMMPKLVVFSGSMECPAIPFQEHRFKIVEPLFVSLEKSIETADPPAGDSGPKPALKPKTRFHPIISRAAARYQIDPDLVRAVIFAESGYNPWAVSKRGAMGLMQLMPGTAKAMGVEDLFRSGAQYLRRG